MNPAYTSTIGLLLYSKNTKKSSGSNIKGIKAPQISMSGVFGKIKKILEPLLP